MIMQLLRYRWSQLIAVGIVTGVVVAVAVSAFWVLARSEDASGASMVGRVSLDSGGAKVGVLTKSGYYQSDETYQEDLRVTAAEAVAAGWKDPILCSAGRGRYFQKGPADEGPPYFLMYDTSDELIGIYLFSKNEMPPPWRKIEELLGGGGLTIIDFEHWGLFVYFRDQLLACTGQQGGCGYTLQC